MSCIIPFLFRLQFLQRIQEDRFDILPISTSLCLCKWPASRAVSTIAYLLSTTTFQPEELQTEKALPFMAGLEASHSTKFASVCEFHLDEYLDEVVKEEDDRHELCDGEERNDEIRHEKRLPFPFAYAPMAFSSRMFTRSARSPCMWTDASRAVSFLCERLRSARSSCPVFSGISSFCTISLPAAGCPTSCS